MVGSRRFCCNMVSCQMSQIGKEFWIKLQAIPYKDAPGKKTRGFDDSFGGCRGSVQVVSHCGSTVYDFLSPKLLKPEAPRSGKASQSWVALLPRPIPPRFSLD